MDDKILDATCESVILLVWLVVTLSKDGTPSKTQNYE
jgi:hypothetical protein